MGSTELALILKFGIPLAIKLLAGGKNETETVEAVQNLVVGMAEGTADLGDTLAKANQEQTANIVQGLYDVVSGAANALANLVNALAGLFK